MEKQQLQAVVDAREAKLKDKDKEAQAADKKIANLTADLHALALEYRGACDSFRGTARIMCNVDNMPADANSIQTRAREELARMPDFCSGMCAPNTTTDGNDGMADDDQRELESIVIGVTISSRLGDPSHCSAIGGATPSSILEISKKKLPLVSAIPTVKVTQEDQQRADNALSAYNAEKDEKKAQAPMWHRLRGHLAGRIHRRAAAGLCERGARLRADPTDRPWARRRRMPS